MNKALYAAIGLLIIAAIGIALMQSAPQPAAPIDTQPVQQPAPDATVPAPVVTTPTPSTQTPQPAPATTGLTIAEVAKHNSAESCYAIVGTGVYDLTEWINQHPGGSRPILGLCGKDGTAQFTRQHGGQTKAEAALASLRIGSLAR